MNRGTDRANGGAPIKILHVCAGVGERSGGLGPIAFGASAAQRVLGHEPAIWTLDAAGANAAPGADGEVVPVRLFEPRGPGQLAYSPHMERTAGDGSGAEFAVLHQHSIWTGTSRVTARWRRKHARPTVIAPQGTLEEYTLRISRWKKQLAWHAYERANLRAAACLQATSEAEVDSFRRMGLRNPVAVIPNGVPEEMLLMRGDGARFRQAHSIPAGARVLLFLSRLHSKKGLPLLFAAMVRLREEMSDWQLAVCGYEDPPGYLAELKKEAIRLGIADRITWAGPQFGAGKDDAIAAADLMVLPTRSDNFAIVVTEALAVGVPVLTTFGAPWRELETHDCGWWVPVTVEGIASGLTEATRMQPAQLAEMGARGRALVAETYTWTTVARRMIRLYEWLLGDGEQPEFVLVD